MTQIASDCKTITVRIPLKIRKRGGRKLVLAPDGQPMLSAPRRIDNAMIKALARAFRWRRLLEDGSYRTIEELAAAEKINSSYVGRVMRLTLLAPELVSAILDGRQGSEIDLARLLRPVPALWSHQVHQIDHALTAPSPGN
jgi:hypothetical protein